MDTGITPDARLCPFFTKIYTQTVSSIQLLFYWCLVPLAPYLSTSFNVDIIVNTFLGIAWIPPLAPHWARHLDHSHQVRKDRTIPLALVSY